MKKVLLGFTCLSILGILGLNNWLNAKEFNDLALENIEALANGESGGNTVDCYSSSDPKRGASYYDCGTCSRQFNSKGTGNMRQCTVPN